MADALSVIPASVLRNLSDKLYEKRKNAALEVPFVSNFDRFWFLGFWVVLLDLGGLVFISIRVCVCVCIGRGNRKAAGGGWGSRQDYGGDQFVDYGLYVFGASELPKGISVN